MKKVLERLLHPDERMKLLIWSVSLGLLLLTAALLPLAFRSAAAAPDKPAQTAEQGSGFALFSRYWNGDDEGLRAETLEQPSRRLESRCEERMEALAGALLLDHAAEYSGPTGREYTLLRDDSGSDLTLCRMWVESRGDWQNWLDVCFDAENGTIYYLYLSRECLRSRSDYASEYVGLSAGDTAAKLAEAYGWTLRYCSDPEGNSAAAVYSADAGTACYQIEIKLFDALIDVKICCK